VTDPSAPSDDKRVVKVSSGVHTSDTVAVAPGAQIEVSGIWDLSGHGTKIELCFVGGSCTASSTMGRLTGTTVYSIPWIEFDLSTTVPAGRTQAYLRWTVASDSQIDYLDLNTGLTPAANGQVTVTVDKMISVDAPALIDFGAGVPGDTLAVTGSTVTVTTNSPGGYTLTMGGTDMTSTTTSDTIAVSAMTYTAGTGPSTAVPPAASPAQVASAAARTGASGQPTSIGLSLTVPFVAGAAYDGTLTFTATTR
jgi:hypothetical protein